MYAVLPDIAALYVFPDDAVPCTTCPPFTTTTVPVAKVEKVTAKAEDKAPAKAAEKKAEDKAPAKASEKKAEDKAPAKAKAAEKKAEDKAPAKASEEKKKEEKDDTTKKKKGSIIRLFSEKNRLCKDKQESHMYLSFKTGPNRYFGLLDDAVEAGIFERVNAKNYIIKDSLHDYIRSSYGFWYAKWNIRYSSISSREWISKFR